MFKFDGTLDDERGLLDRLVKSQEWKLFVANRRDFIKPMQRKALGQTCENRDWVAGYVTAVDDMLNWPAERIETIDEKLAKLERQPR